MLKEFKSAATYIGEKNILFKAVYIGKYSIISAADISILLDNVPILLIMLANIWSLDSFLKYNRKKIVEFSEGL